MATIACLALLSLLWAVQVALVLPAGDFALNDDWAYGLPTLLLADEGILRFTHWQSMPLITQVGWGAFFCKVLGASFTSLRISTVVAGWIALVTLYVLLRRVATPTVAFLGSFTLAANPVFIALSCTFMTDVPFLALTLLSLLLLSDGARLDHAGKIFLGTLLACAATLLRQTGLVIPLAFAVGYLAHGGFRAGRWCRAIMPMLVVCVVLFAFEQLVESTIGLPDRYHLKEASALRALGDLLHLRFGMLRYPARAAFVTCLYLGLFALPFLVLVMPGILRACAPREKRLYATVAVLFCVLATTVCVSSGWTMPLTGNIMVDCGIGPRTISGSVSHAPRALWVVITLIAVLAGSILIAGICLSGRRLIHHVRQGVATRSPCVATGVAGVLLIAPSSCVYGAFFDRYVLAVLPFLLVFLAGATTKCRYSLSRVTLPPCILLLVVYASFGTAATHDYLEWNRRQWQLADSVLEDNRSAPNGVDAGFAWNNYYANVTALPGNPTINEAVRRDDVEYRISCSHLPEHMIVGERDCRTWLPWAIDKVYLLRTQAGRSGADRRVRDEVL